MKGVYKIVLMLGDVVDNYKIIINFKSHKKWHE